MNGAYEARFKFWLSLLGCPVMAANNAKIDTTPAGNAGVTA